MKDAESPQPEITPALLLRAYAAGVFPMADGAHSTEIFWVEPRYRGIMPLDGFHVSRSLRKRLLKDQYSIRIDSMFDLVVAACADRDETWINAEIAQLYRDLFALGHAHSLEVWRDDRLIGGVYGVQLGAAFFGESMFSRARDGSKIALAYLVARLRHGGFRLFDTQFTTPHLESLGAINIPRIRYQELLAEALTREADFYSLAVDASPSRALHLISQTS